MLRRQFLARGALLAAAAGIGGSLFGRRSHAAEGTFPITKTDDEWRRQLSADQFAVLREEATERPFTSDLLKNHRHGIYTCAGCSTDLYSSETKFDSGTGWPSFWQEIDGGIATTTDYKLVYPRTEVHCANCGGHLGHVFDDGPQPTGKRHCINGIALGFRETAASG